MDHDWSRATARLVVMVTLPGVWFGSENMTDYLLIKSFRAAVILCGVALLQLWVVIHRIGAPLEAIPFRGTHIAAYDYVVGCINLVGLVAIFIKTPNRFEKQLCAIAFAMSVVDDFTFLYAPRPLLPYQYTVGGLSVLFTVTSLRVLVDVAKPLFREARAQRAERETRGTVSP